MKALTLHQPWASLIALGIKKIETRSWSTSYRGPLAIHAGRTVPFSKFCGRSVGDMCSVGDWQVWYASAEEPPVWCMAPLDGGPTTILPLGAVVAVVDLVDVVPIVADPAFPDPPRDYVKVGQRAHGPSLSLVEYEGRIDLGAFGRPRSWGVPRSLTGQLPFGDFTPGRFAWLLDNIRPLDEPIPAKGRQGLWDVALCEVKK